MPELLPELDGLVFSQLGQIAAPFQNELYLLDRFHAGDVVGGDLFGLELQLSVQPGELPPYQHVPHVLELPHDFFVVLSEVFLFFVRGNDLADGRQEFRHVSLGLDLEVLEILGRLLLLLLVAIVLAGFVVLAAAGAVVGEILQDDRLVGVELDFFLGGSIGVPHHRDDAPQFLLVHQRVSRGAVRETETFRASDAVAVDAVAVAVGVAVGVAGLRRPVAVDAVTAGVVVVVAVPAAVAFVPGERAVEMVAVFVVVIAVPLQVQQVVDGRIPRHRQGSRFRDQFPRYLSHRDRSLLQQGRKLLGREHGFVGPGFDVLAVGNNGAGIVAVVGLVVGQPVVQRNDAGVVVGVRVGGSIACGIVTIVVVVVVVATVPFVLVLSAPLL
mmetsp:Transcript_13191/g.27010  ORF Transcript_13191/g.27010 Transcript_13191/m.27010 type:complete len:384 (-) Transcript_13191:552-1703(-)